VSAEDTAGASSATHASDTAMAAEYLPDLLLITTPLAASGAD
jgi:hypothetical protein